MRATTVVAAVATMAYPFAVWLGLARFEPRWLALGLLALVVLRAGEMRSRRTALFAGLGAGVLVVATWLHNDALPLKLYPVVVNATLLAVFAASLVRPPEAGRGRSVARGARSPSAAGTGSPRTRPAASR